jgi:excisionase family DNA binding protein
MKAKNNGNSIGSLWGPDFYRTKMGQIKKQVASFKNEPVSKRERLLEHQEHYSSLIKLKANDGLMTISQVAKLLNVHVNTIKKWSNQGIIRPDRVGHRGNRIFKREDIEQFLSGAKTNEK